MSRQPPVDFDNKFGWDEQTQMEYEQWCREQDTLPTWQATYDDYLEAMKENK